MRRLCDGYGGYIFYIVVVFLVLVGLVFGLTGASRQTSAAEPVKSEEIWNDGWGLASLFKIQDGHCVVYVVRGYGGDHVSVTVGQGCRP
jgi:hypothetical protein